jgi:thiol-disulfide isomerase/thioredoxin
MTKTTVEIIYFYMDGCYYCKEFNPIWNDLCLKLENIISTFKYNANELENDKPKKIIDDYGEEINGFPTILIKINNKYHNYNSNRDVTSIINFILEKLDKNDKIYKSLQQNNKKTEDIKTNDVELTYFYMNGCYYCNEFNPTWNELCDKLDKKIIKINKYERKELDEHDTPKRIISEYGTPIKGYPTILLKVNDTYYKYDRERTVKSLIQFIASKLNENDKLYKYLLGNFAEIITKTDENMIGGNINNNINYRNKYKKYKQMYAELAIKYNDLKKLVNIK